MRFSALLGVVCALAGSAYGDGIGWEHQPLNKLGCGCVNGELTIWATHDNVDLECVFDGWVNYGHKKRGLLPRMVGDKEVTDFSVIWNCAGVEPNPDCGCPTERLGVYKPVYRLGLMQGQWELENLSDWIAANAATDLVLPFLATPGCGPAPEIYIAVDLGEWDNRPTLSDYLIVDGRHPELPGYLIGTTPIVFDPSAPEGTYPLTTTPFNGELVPNGQTTLGTGPTIPALSGGSLAALAVLVVVAGLVVLLRRRGHAAPSE